MHPVLVKEQNFAHFPGESNHVCDAQESAATVIIMQPDNKALCSKT